MSLRFKIISGFLILAIMLFAAGALSIYELTHIGQSVQTLLDENYRSISAAKNMIEALEREDSGILLLASGERGGSSIIEAADRDFQNAFKVAQNNLTIPGEDRYVASISTAYEGYKNSWPRAITGHRTGDLTWYFSQVHPAFLEAKDKVNQLMNLNDNTLYKTASALKNRARRSIMPGIVAIISSFLFTAVFNFFINLYFIAPIKKLTAGIRKYINTGERSGLRVSSHDEISDLSTAIEDLTIFRRKE